MRLVFASAAILLISSLNAYAAPPEGSKLSEIIAKIEQTADVQYVDEVDWNDRGYYEIEYIMKNGAKAEIKIDPKTGDTVR
ncbi:MAG: PepSY domain-containing protein [Phyllobacterium sp.]